MSWTEITLDVPDSLKDAVGGELSDLGAEGLWENERASGWTRLTAYFRLPVDVDAVRTSLLPFFERTGAAAPEITSSPVENKDWGEEWKKSWTSFALGNRFFVVPSWLDDACPPGRIALHIDPGQAFGTGTHETTQLTLEALEALLANRNQHNGTVFDLGTGSGILAIAAVKLGASRVWACDNDPVAVEVAAENSQRNTPDSIGFTVGSIDAVADDSVDVLLCNLTADVITTLLEDIRRSLRNDSVGLFSGILVSQLPEMRENLLAAGLRVTQEAERGEWCVLITRKNGR